MKNTNCPRCNSDVIEGESFDVTDDQVMQNMHCLQCNHAWVDIYQLVQRAEHEDASD